MSTVVISFVILLNVVPHTFWTQSRKNRGKGACLASFRGNYRGEDLNASPIKVIPSCISIDKGSVEWIYAMILGKEMSVQIWARKPFYKWDDLVSESEVQHLTFSARSSTVPFGLGGVPFVGRNKDFIRMESALLCSPGD